MIGRLSGLLREKNPPQLLLEVGGVGYEIDVPMSTFYSLPRVGDPVTLHTHLTIREDAHLLYGFATERERHVFRLLIRISGVGAKTALAVLSGMDVDGLTEAIALQETARLTRVPGIGKKTAERLLLELKGKLGDALPGAGVGGAPAERPGANDVLNALLALGYSDKEAVYAVKQVPEGTAVSDGIRMALKLLSKA
ncbi:MAG: Holliday junction branch migration protein RuvA [Proteobacteria bacterium]|nr:Holliday junction branch migration protein RuvA [Burkholderiales bacterium]